MNEVDKAAMEAAFASSSTIYLKDNNMGAFRRFAQAMFEAALAHARSETPAETWRPIASAEDLPKEFEKLTTPA